MAKTHGYSTFTNLLLVIMIVISVLTLTEIYALKSTLLTTEVPVDIPVQDDGIHLIEFFDYQCPYCKVALNTINDLKVRYGDRLIIEYKHFPLPSHSGASLAAQAAECAREQERFEEYHLMLFAHQSALAKEDLLTYATQLGLNKIAFKSCLDSGATLIRIQADVEEGRKKGVTGTPAFFVDGKLVQGAQPAEAFIAVIEGSAQPSVKLTIDDDPTLGDKDAPLVMYEFSDFQCPFCARFHYDTFAQIKIEYIDTGKVFFVYKDLPLDFHAQALPAAIAAQCAHAQGKFWEYHEKIFENQQGLSETIFTDIAQGLGLDMAAFAACQKTGASEARNDANQAASVGISGTPGFFIGGEVVEGAMPFATFKALIDRKLSEANP